MISNKDLILKAFGEIGVKEAPGDEDNPDIVKYHAFATIENQKGMPDSVPWCSSFICFCTESVGLNSTNNKMARSWEHIGTHVEIEAALPGDVIVFYRNGLDSGQGHVSILLKVIKSCFGYKVYCLGGNQNDSVNITRYSTAKMTQIRRVADQQVYSEKEIAELKSIANKMISNQKVDDPSSVT